MTATDFYQIFFDNELKFVLFMLIACVLLFFSVRSIAVAGYLDPIHFYWTFTFGSAYGVVVGLHSLGHISDRLFFLVIAYGALFIFSFIFFTRFPIREIGWLYKSILVPNYNKEHCFRLIGLVLGFLLVLIVLSGGIGLFAEVNRFEQNRGIGAYVRLADALRLFVIAYLGVSVMESTRSSGWTLKSFALLLLNVLVVLVSSAVNGAKFAFLEALYAIFVASALYYARRPKFSLKKVIFVFLTSLIFALVTLSMNLSNTEAGADMEPQYIEGGSFVVERLILRVIANADKYYLGLPNDVIDGIDTDSLVVRLLSPLAGVTNMGSWLGYDVGNYTVGRQILLFYDPGLSVAGGPTSHFDLFVHKYIGAEFGWVGVLLIAFFLGSVSAFAKYCKNDLYAASLASVFWVRSLPVLLEPPVGLAYVVDLVLFFSAIKLISVVVSRRQVSVSVSGC